MKSIFMGHESSVRAVFEPLVLEKIRKYTDLADQIYTKEDLLANPSRFAEVDYIFSTWGMPALTEEEIKQVFPNLKVVFYAAGTVQNFARPFLNCGVRVFSAWAANAVPVAEVTVAQIILANKGFFQKCRLNSQNHRDEAKTLEYPGNYGETVGLLGAGMIGSKVIELLKPYNLKVIVCDPFMSPEKAERLGVEKCTLEEVFERSMVVSNHMANKKETEKMLHYGLFSKMRPHATFLNTARGAQVNEDDLIRVLQERPDLTAVLDVTWPEPPVPESLFYELPNCYLTPHIAGSNGKEVSRMAVYMLEEFEHMLRGEKLSYEVSLEMLSTMA